MNVGLAGTVAVAGVPGVTTAGVTTAGVTVGITEVTGMTDLVTIVIVEASQVSHFGGTTDVIVTTLVIGLVAMVVIVVHVVVATQTSHP